MNSRNQATTKLMCRFSVPVGAVGMRADVFLASKYPEFTRSSLERLFDDGNVTISNQPIKPSHKMKTSDKVEVDETPLRHMPATIDLPIIYEDKNVLVINKPEGILSHSKGALNEESTVASFIIPKLDSKMSGNRAGIVHRLDRPTSGVIITVKNLAAQSKVQKQFAQRTTKKTYWAIVEGTPELPEASIEAPIQRNPKKPQSFRVNVDGKPASTHYKSLKSFIKSKKTYSLLELKPQTGRTHQLRVHLAYVGHPIVGDRVYGKEGEHLYLHAYKLELTLPDVGRRVFTAKLPSYFNNFLE